MSVFHLHIKFVAIVKSPFRPHLAARELEDRVTKTLLVVNPEVSPKSGAFRHVGIRQ